MTSAPTLVREDSFLDGAVRVRQPAAGYRAGADAVFLAAALTARPGDALLELGCGAGAALLMAATHLPDVTLTGLERDPAAAALAEENAAANRLLDRVSVIEGDLAAPPEVLRRARFQQVFFNPPFYVKGQGRAPSEAKRGAYLEEGADLAMWIDFALRRLADRGFLTLIHRADRLDDVLAGLRGRAGAIAVKPLSPAPGAAATRVVVRARKSAGGPLRLLAPLVLHEGGAGREVHSKAAEAILRGRARLELDEA